MTSGREMSHHSIILNCTDSMKMNHKGTMFCLLFSLATRSLGTSTFCRAASSFGSASFSSSSSLITSGVVFGSEVFVFSSAASLVSSGVVPVTDRDYTHEHQAKDDNIQGNNMAPTELQVAATSAHLKHIRD